MKTTGIFQGVAVLCTALLAVACGQGAEQVAVDADDIGGVVTGPNGPEAGVWVIAETTDLPTKFSRTVVTDDLGQYVVPDLPEASYDVWVRGYGLVDSAKVQAAPGETLDLTAVPAPSAAAAAEYYPAVYWYSKLNIPAASEFPGTGPQGNGIPEAFRTQAHYLRLVKTDRCEACHQMGNQGTRTISESLGSFESSTDAWQRRLQSGQAGANMVSGIAGMGARPTLAMFADWTDRIAAGELPSETPPRPEGQERNVVISQWDWVNPGVYLHDSIGTDKRDPTVNANGKLYGSTELSAEFLPVLDPVSHTVSEVPVPLNDPNTLTKAPQTGFMASVYWGEEAIWPGQANVHNPMMDHLGRVWITSRVRSDADQPAFCGEGSSHPSAQATPTTRSGRQLAVHDPATGETKLIDTCFGTHHVHFAYDDENHTAWTSGDPGVVGWLNTKMYDETGDAEASQGWTALILDHNGNGIRDAYTEADEPVDPNMDRNLNRGFYGVMPSPADGSVWGTLLGMPGGIARIAPGDNPPATAISEYYEVPFGPDVAVQGFSPRGLDVDQEGVVWTVLASGHFASFDRRLCTGPLNGPTATGQHCQEGWTLHQTPGPEFANVEYPGSADSHYYDWVDQFDTFGLGANTPIATGNGSDALLALDKESGEFTILRVPYPLGFFAKGMDGRIDDPTTGWKGKGIYTTWGTRTTFHTEGGTDNVAKIVKFQLRPDPTAK